MEDVVLVAVGTTATNDEVMTADIATRNNRRADDVGRAEIMMVEVLFAHSGWDNNITYLVQYSYYYYPPPCMTMFKIDSVFIVHGLFFFADVVAAAAGGKQGDVLSHT